MAPAAINGEAPPTNGHANGTNGANGHSLSSNKPRLESSLPVTSILSEWVASSTDTSVLTPAIRTKLNELILDYIGITAAAAKTSESTPPIVAAITSLSPPQTNGGCTVITKGSGYAPHIASLLNGTFCHSLDFDDTHAPSTLHPGVTSISAALACSESSSKATVERHISALTHGRLRNHLPNRHRTKLPSIFSRLPQHLHSRHFRRHWCNCRAEVPISGHRCQCLWSCWLTRSRKHAISRQWLPQQASPPWVCLP